MTYSILSKRAGKYSPKSRTPMLHGINAVVNGDQYFFIFRLHNSVSTITEKTKTVV